MRASLFKALPYLAALGGVAAISLLIALLRSWVDVPNLSVTYLLLVRPNTSCCDTSRSMPASS